MTAVAGIVALLLSLLSSGVSPTGDTPEGASSCSCFPCSSAHSPGATVSE